MNLEYKEITVDEIDLIRPLWEGLNQHHKKLSPNFPDYYTNLNFERRKRNLLGKSGEVKYKIDIVIDADNSEKAGYCISSINHDGEGEIDSLFIKENYRNCGVGDTLMKSALEWMNSYNAESIKIQVAAGNEEVFKFYERYNFYPKYTMLYQKG